MSEAPVMPGLEDLRARMEEVKAKVYERLQTMPFAENLPGIIFKPPAIGTQRVTPMARIQTMLNQRPKLLSQTVFIRGVGRGLGKGRSRLLSQYTASNLPPFNFPGIASRLLRGQRPKGQPHAQRRGAGSRIETARKSLPVSRNISIVM